MRICISCILFILLLGGNMLYAQISSSASVYHEATQYPSTENEDTVYVFCAQEDNTGYLEVRSSDLSAGWTFVWQKYNPVTHAFDIPVPSQTDQDSISFVQNLESGGYQATLTKGAVQETYVAWVFNNILTVSNRIANNLCGSVTLGGDTASNQLTYCDLSTQDTLSLTNGLEFRWSSDPESAIPLATSFLFPTTYLPPVVDTEYFLTLTSRFGCSEQASVWYETIQVKADFEADHETDPASAPLEVSFTNNSINAAAYHWNFGVDEELERLGKTTNEPDTSTLETPNPVTYYYPSQYVVVLTARSEEGCEDSTKVTIVVDESLLQIPNVFSPTQKDNVNDIFIFQSVSLSYMELTIFSRSGRKVHKYEGDPRDWKGWDGRINDSEQLVKQGVYYYYLLAKGWDDKIYEQSGPLHLY